MKNILLVVLLATSISVLAQKQTAKPAQPPAAAPATPAQQPQINPMVEHFGRKNALANRWNDAEVAKNALYDLIAEIPGNDSLIYALAMQYFEARQYVSAVLVAQDLLRNNPRNEDVLQLAASGYEALGLKDKALTHYETVYLLNNSTAILYKMAVLQYDLKKFPEAKINADILLTKKDLDSLKVRVGGDADANQKEYAIRAAILNLKGLILGQENDKAGAKKAFEEALVASPDFPLAKQNLAKLK